MLKNSQNVWLSVGVSQSASEMANLLNKERGTWEKKKTLFCLLENLSRDIHVLNFDLKELASDDCFLDPYPELLFGHIESGSGLLDIKPVQFLLTCTLNKSEPDILISSLN